MKRDTMLADYMMLPWSALGKGMVVVLGSLAVLPKLVLPVGAFVVAALLVNKVLNQRSSG